MDSARARSPRSRTGDASAYLISRGFAARALEIHRGYTLPLDVALFDPATCPAVAQVDPALTIQQRYADFRRADERLKRRRVLSCLNQRSVFLAAFAACSCAISSDVFV